MRFRPPARSSGPAWKIRWTNGRAAAAAGEPAEALEAKLERLKQEQLTPEQRLIKEIMADPTAVHAYVELADIYRKHGDLDKAEKVLAKGRKANPDDHGLASIYEDTQISRLKKARDSQQHRVQQYAEDTAAKAKLDQLNEMLNKYEIEAFRRARAASSRGCRSSTSTWASSWRGSAIMTGRSPSFSRRARAPARTQKIQALYHLGLSFEANNAPKLAERNYKEAIKLLDPEDKDNFTRPALPAGPGRRDAGQQRGRRRALQRSRRQRLLVSRRRPAAETLDLIEKGML